MRKLIVVSAICVVVLSSCQTQQSLYSWYDSKYWNFINENPVELNSYSSIHVYGSFADKTSSFIFRGLDLEYDVEALIIRTDLYLRTPDKKEYLVKGFQLDVTEFECAYKKQIKYKDKVMVSYGDKMARIKNEDGETCFLVKFN